MRQNTVYVGKWKILFIRDETNFFIPYLHECYINEKGKLVGKKITYDAKDKLSVAMFMFVYFVHASGTERDKTTGEQEQGHLDIYQYLIAYRVIRGFLRLKSEDMICAIARQAGKSHLARLLVAFSITFIPLYVKIKHDRWYSTLCSFKKQTATDQYKKTYPVIVAAIELFNNLYPNSKLQYDCLVKDAIGGKNKKLKANDEGIEINREVNGKSISYSALDVLGVENSNNPGYTSFFEFVDRFCPLKTYLLLESPKAV